MKIFFKITSLITFIIFIIIALLSYGISTNKFNNKIISKFEQKIPNSTINFKDASISLDLFSLAIKVNINEPNVKINNQSIILNSFIIFTDLKSSINKKYLLKKIKINFAKNDVLILKEISLIKNFKIIRDLKFIEGTVSGNLIIDQLQNDQYKTVFTGKLSDVVININEDLPFVKKINCKINYSKTKVLFSELSGNFGEFDLISREVSYLFDKRLLTGTINLKGRLNPSINLKKIIPKKISIDFENFDNLGGQFEIDANLKVNFNKNFAVKKDETTFNLTTKNLKFNYKKFEKLIFTKINTSINFNNYGKIFSKGEFELNNKKNKFKISRLNNKRPFKIKTSGIVNIQEIFSDKIIFPVKNNIRYSSETLLNDIENYTTEVKFDLINSKVDLPLFNYVKKKNDKSNFEFSFIKNKKFYKFSKINYVSNNNNNIYIRYLLFDDKFSLIDLGNININLGEKNKLKMFKKNNIYNIVGSRLDLSKYLSQKNKKKYNNLKLKINGGLRMDIKKIFIPGDFLIDYKNSIQIKKGEIIELDSFANFEDLSSFSHQVIKNKFGNKSIVINSDKAKPFLKAYQFLKGIDKGTLDINREYLPNKSSITEVKIENFYLKEMPFLTKILSVASLTGALDILEGKGIFFKEAYLKYELVNEELRILECYGTGPSLGFVLGGRIGKDDFASLNGSLAPANTINNIVREIPVVGKILTGKKGDGIFGASFKIKGKDNLKVEVNPIKTLTPRFIQRFLKIFKK